MSKLINVWILRLMELNLIIMLLFVFFALSGTSFASGQKKFVITHTSGQKTTANDLCAYYEAGGMWAGKRPSECISAVNLLITIKESRDNEDRISIPFSDINQIDFEGLSKTYPETINKVHIKRRDGSHIMLNKKENIFEEKNQQGQISIKHLVLKRWYWVGGTLRIDGKPLEWKGFKGKTKTSDNKIVDLTFKLSDIKSIAFK